MNKAEESFWRAQMAFQSNRLDEACLHLRQAIEQLEQPTLTLEQVELIWAVIPRVTTARTRSIERLVHYHQRMPMETDEMFDRLTQSYVQQLEREQADHCLTLIRCLDAHLIHGRKDIDHVHLNRLQADLYLQLSHVSRPYRSQLFYNQHRTLMNDNEQIMNMYRN